MSKTETISNDKELFLQLSTQYKVPLRNILGETQEAVQNTISNMIEQLIQIHNALKDANQEIERLKKLCDDNKINHTIPPSNGT